MSDWFTQPSRLPEAEELHGVHVHGTEIHHHGANIQGHTHLERMTAHEAAVRSGLGEPSQAEEATIDAIRRLGALMAEEFRFMAADSGEWEKAAAGILTKMQAQVTSGDDVLVITIPQ